MNNTYTAWALYTGPEQPTPLWENSRWITGQWNGKLDLKKDIDARIDRLIEKFKECRKNTAGSGGSFTNYFVVPEFYFRCQYGPYPTKEIVDGEMPYEYICSSLEDRIKNIPSQKIGPGESWIICAGSVLTCNVPDADVEKFLGSDRVKNRLDKLNKEIRKLSKELGYKTAKDFKTSSTYIKALSYPSRFDMVKSGTLPVGEPEAAKNIDALMLEFRSDPLCTVRNRGILFKALFNGKNSTHVESWKYEKQNESTVDLTMGKLVSKNELEHGNMITEWMANYPSISIINGDKNTDNAPMAARITINNSPGTKEKQEIGVEICLDHRLKRLRRTVEMTKENGAAENNPPLNLQLIPSGGMQILEESVAAGASGAIFNCDGCDPVLDQYNENGKQIIDGSGSVKQIACGVYAISAQTMVKIPEQENRPEHKYYSHSQLCFRYGTDELDGYNNALGKNNKNGQTYVSEGSGKPANPVLDAYELLPNLPQEYKDGDLLFAAGLGALHIYRRKR
jgi:hypothetical protein